MDNSPRSITIYQEEDLLFIRVRSCDAIEKVEAIDGHVAMRGEDSIHRPLAV